MLAPTHASQLRERILQVLRDDTAARSEGDEFIDLQDLAHGVLVADSVQAPMGHALPRRAVYEATWRAIRDLLARE